MGARVVTAFLLDANAVLWLVSTPATIAPSVRAQLENPANELFVSAASAWEIAIKTGIGRVAAGTLLSAWDETLEAMNASSLAIESADAIVAGQLTWAHGDPFDRMLVAQAVRRGLTIATTDDNIRTGALTRVLTLQPVGGDMSLTPTDWAEDVRERFKVKAGPDDPEPEWVYLYTDRELALCRRIVEPIALHLAAEDDWLYLDDVKLLTDYHLTTSVAPFELVNRLHPHHPPARDDGHHARLIAARNALHGHIVAEVADAVTRGELSSKIQSYIEAWSGTYADCDLIPSGWSPPNPLGPPDVRRALGPRQ